MKPEMPLVSPRRRPCFDEQASPARTLPCPGYFFQSGCNFSLGFSSPHDDENRRFRNLSRQFLSESAREQKRELFVLSLLALVSAWPLISMVVTVVQLYSRPHP